MIEDLRTRYAKCDFRAARARHDRRLPAVGASDRRNDRKAKPCACRAPRLISTREAVEGALAEPVREPSSVVTDREDDILVVWRNAHHNVTRPVRERVFQEVRERLIDPQRVDVLTVLRALHPAARPAVAITVRTP